MNKILLSKVIVSLATRGHFHRVAEKYAKPHSLFGEFTLAPTPRVCSSVADINTLSKVQIPKPNSNSSLWVSKDKTYTCRRCTLITSTYEPDLKIISSHSPVSRRALYSCPSFFLLLVGIAFHVSLNRKYSQLKPFQGFESNGSRGWGKTKAR